MKVLVNGIGNIGTTILNVIHEYKQEFGIETIYGLKNTSINVWNRAELDLLIEKGIKICARGTSEFVNLDSVIDEIDYIFDCTANGFGLSNKEWYSKTKNLKACSAQGSEKGFGIPFMSGLNNSVIKKEKFVQIVSCNTHALAAILNTFVSNNFDQLEEADFVIVRRSEDLGNHERLVSANVVSRHLSNSVGTHHAIDVIDLYKTLGIELNIQSSDITTPSQLMHVVRFNLKLETGISAHEIDRLIEENPYLAISKKFDSNVIFELGRRYGPFGRLYAHAIVNSSNLLIQEEGRSIKGWAFIPQEGNTILSTIDAFMLQLDVDNRTQIMDKIRKRYLKQEW